MSNTKKEQWGKWKFTRYPLKQKTFKDLVEEEQDFKGNYIFCKIINRIFYPVYIGKSKIVAERILDHKVDQIYDGKTAWKYSDEVHIREESKGFKREEIESDLVSKLNPPMNSDYRTEPSKKVTGLVSDRITDWD